MNHQKVTWSTPISLYNHLDRNLKTDTASLTIFVVVISGHDEIIH